MRKVVWSLCDLKLFEHFGEDPATVRAARQRAPDARHGARSGEVTITKGETADARPAAPATASRRA